MGRLPAGICGTLALVWVVISTHRQGEELAGQANELSRQTSALKLLGEATENQAIIPEKQSIHLGKQSEALSQQADALKASLYGQKVIGDWNDLNLIAETLRDILPTNGYPAWTVKGEGTAIRMVFTGATSEEMKEWSNFRFLSRTAGGLKHPVKDFMKCKADNTELVL